MDNSELLPLIGAAAAISAILLGWIGRARLTKQDIKDNIQRDARMSADVEYIKRGVDEMRLEQRAQGKRFDELSERVTRVEESAKSAHHRIDCIGKGRADD